MSIVYVCVFHVLTPARGGTRSHMGVAVVEFGDELLVLFMRELACVVFEYSFSRLATGCVEQHDRGDIVPVWFGDAGYLLGQDPHGDAVVPGGEAEINQLARAVLDIFRRSAVV